MDDVDDWNGGEIATRSTIRSDLGAKLIGSVNINLQFYFNGKKNADNVLR